METLEEIREKLIKLESFVEANKQTPRRLEVKNLETLRTYYQNTNSYILEELSSKVFPTIRRIIDQRKANIYVNATLIMDSDYGEQTSLISMFNEDLSQGVFKDSIFQDGIFLPSSRSNFKEKPEKYLFLNYNPERENMNVQHIRFYFNIFKLLNNPNIDTSLKDDLKNYLLQTSTMTPEEYNLIREYFLEHAPFILNGLLQKFKDEYIKAKRECTPVMLSTALINITEDRRVLTVLEYLFDELLKQDIFKDTIFENATTSLIINKSIKFFNPILMNPLEQNGPLRQCNLRLLINTNEIEKRNTDHITMV